MDDHECIIGLLHYCDYSVLVTRYELKHHIQESIEENKKLDENPFVREPSGLYNKCLSMRDYTDIRKLTDLTRFDYCPVCGKKINWAYIRRKYNDQRIHRA